MCNYGSGPNAERFSKKSIEFGTVVQKEMLFKGISYLEHWHTLCSVDWNHLCNFGRVHHEE